MVGEKNKCDGSGCITACCKGCSCCIAKTGIIQSKDNEITLLKQKVLELMTRQTTIGSADRLSQENQRLRAERNHYRDNNEEANKLVAKLTASLTNLTAKVQRLEKDNQELRNKVERINKQIETPSKR